MSKIRLTDLAAIPTRWFLRTLGYACELIPVAAQQARMAKARRLRLFHRDGAVTVGLGS
ncbi:hypothetical protein [Micromonospora sp. NPDC092111]|uniref:hypothetical protein n=1 Tax=Micromonospora sp. NPDC092111 TaxID=3364289 RepID=UPI003816B816